MNNKEVKTRPINETWTVHDLDRAVQKDGFQFLNLYDQGIYIKRIAIEIAERTKELQKEKIEHSKKIESVSSGLSSLEELRKRVEEQEEIWLKDKMSKRTVK